MAQSARLGAAEKQLQIALWIAGGLALVVFLMVLLFGRRHLAERDKLNVNWEQEEEKLRRIAELRKATRSPQERAAAAIATPVREAQPAAAGSSPEASAPQEAPADELDPLLRGLSD